MRGSENVSTNIWKKARIKNLTISIQHSAGSTSKSNCTRKKKEKAPTSKGKK
jgi:hypothetical protein